MNPLRVLSILGVVLSLWVVDRARAQVTYDPTNFTFEAEDFNFDGGQYFDTIVLCQDFGGGTMGCYFDRVGWTNIDELEINFVVATNLDESVYRYGPEFNPRYEFVDTFLTDDSLVRPKYTMAGIPDYEVRSIVSGEWLNYTRTFPAGNYRIYMRVSSGSTLTVDLDNAANSTTTSQTLTYLGRFATTNATTGYEFVPLMDFSGSNAVIVAFPGTAQTVRATARSAGYTPNFYMLVASTNSANMPPNVQITSPAGGAILTEGVAVSLQATATDAESSVTNVQFYAGTAEPLTFIGETNASPASVSWTPPSLGTITNYTIRVVARDATGLAGARQITVEVRDPNIHFISNATGAGADAEMREQEDTGVTSGLDTSIRVRNSSGNNEMVALRFDLTGFNLARLTEVQLKMTSFRDDTSTRQVALYGVAQGTAGASGPYTTENWDEDNLTEFGYMPGLLNTDGNPLTQSINTNSATLLAQISGTYAKGEIKTFGSQALSDFVRSYSGSSKVTFLLANAPGYTSTGQSQFASKESSSLSGGAPAGSVGDFAPILQVKELTNAPPFVTITNPVDGVELGTGVEVTLAASAFDTDGTVTNVDFYVGTTKIGSDTTAPYSAQWTTPNTNVVTEFTLRAIASDNVGITTEDTIAVSVAPPFFQVVSTVVGDGQDIEVREPNNNVSDGSSMNVRTSPNADRNEIIGLKFDLAGFTLTNIYNVRLKLIAFRSDSSTRYPALYGVAQGTAGAEGSQTTETWTESNLTTFGSMPGLLATDGDYLSQSINTNQTIYLGQITVSGGSVPEGGVITFNSPELTSFIQSYGGSSKLTFLLAAGTPLSSGQFRIASREASSLATTVTGNPGDFAPYLEFQEFPGVPPSVTITNPANNATLEGGTQILIGVNATDSDGSVTNVDFYAGTSEPLALIGSDSTAPFSLPWTPAAVRPVNYYTIRTIATDNSGFTDDDSVRVKVVTAGYKAVSTTNGDGSDVEMRERVDGGVFNQTPSNTGQLNARTSSSGDRNEVIGLKFDLTGFNLANLYNLALNLTAFRFDGSERVLNLYGVSQGTTSGSGNYTTATWSDTLVELYGDLPGLQSTDSNALTQNIDLGHVTPLGTFNIAADLPEGTVHTLSSAALATFIQGYTGSSTVTFIVAAGNDSTGQFRVASKEAIATATGVLAGPAGELAPYLTFTIGPTAPPNLVYKVTSGGAGIDFSWAGIYKLQYQTNTVATGLRTNWVDYPAGSSSPVSVPVNKTQGAVFFRLSP